MPPERKGKREESGPRTAARQAAIQVLYGIDASQRWAEPVEPELARYWANLEGPADGRAYGDELVRGVASTVTALDAVLRASAPNWRLERMAGVDRTVLRVAVWEMLHNEIPPEVAIDEAIELARLYGTAEAASFVNGVLDRVARDHGKSTRRAPPGE